MADDTEDVEDSNLIAHIADAGAWYRHAEIIVQQRLYNFLMAASILILAAATSLSANAHPAQRTDVLTVSLVGLLLSLAYSVLGYRQIRFVDLHMDIAETLEARLQDKRNQVVTQIAILRSGKEATSPRTGSVLALSKLEQVVRSSHLLVAAPLAFALVFLVLAWLGYATLPCKVMP